MGLSKYTLGNLLDRNTEYNDHLTFGISSVRGVLNTKGIADTKVSVDERDLSKFLVVRPGGFIFNHRVHDKLGLGYNTSDDVYIFTNDYPSSIQTTVRQRLGARIFCCLSTACRCASSS